MEQTIDAQIAHLLPSEIAGAYKALCSMLMIQTAVSYRTRVRRKDDAWNRRTAQLWIIDGDVGAITFAQACEACEVTPEVARKGFSRIADGRMDRTKAVGSVLGPTLHRPTMTTRAFSSVTPQLPEFKA